MTKRNYFQIGFGLLAFAFFLCGVVSASPGGFNSTHIRNAAFFGGGVALAFIAVVLWVTEPISSYSKHY